MGFLEFENNRINYKVGTYNRISAKFDENKHYLDTIWKYLSWEIVNFDNWKRKNNADNTDENNLIENRVKARFPHFFLASVFNSVYTIFESELGSINSFLITHYDPKFLDKDEKKLEKTNDNFEILKIILKTIDIEFKKINPEYDDLKLFKKLRDNISHRNHQVLVSKPNDSRFRTFISKMDGIGVSEGMWVQEGAFQTFIFTSEYPVKKFIDTASSFFAKLLELGYPSETDKLSI